MAATSMPQISLLVERLYADFPDLSFVIGDDFQWSPDTNTITHPRLTVIPDLQQLLHEISHAELGHTKYTRDIELIDMERQAWSHASNTLGPRYGVDLTMDDDTVQDSLDSYRTWLHSRSSCPSCTAVGGQISQDTYRCLSCQQTWRVNQAKTCRLKRLKL